MLTSSRSAIRATIRPKHSCFGWSAAPDRAASPGCIRGTGASSGRCSAAGVRICAPGSTQRLPFVEDESNTDVSIPRNRVRAELLPLLEARFNPGIVDVLADEAELAREAWQWMDATAADLASRLVRRSSAPGGAPVREIDVAGLRAAPLALQRAVLWRVMSEVAGQRPVAFGHVEAAIRLSSPGDARGGDEIDVPGQRCNASGRGSS